MSRSKSTKTRWKFLAGKRRWSKAEARAVVDAWRASCQRIQTFAREQGLGAWQLRYWAPRFGAPSKPNKRPSKELRFIPAVLTGASASSRPAVLIPVSRTGSRWSSTMPNAPARETSAT